MPNMICQRNFTLRTTLGHVIQFEAGKPKYVPPECVDSALAVNIIMESGGFASRSEASVVGPVRVAAMSHELREALLLHAIDEIVRDNETNSFDAGSKPKASVIKERANLEINATERTRLWDKYRDLKSNNADLPKPRNFDLVLDAQQSSTSKQLLEMGSLFGISADQVRGFTLRELKGAVVQAAINYNPVLPTANDAFGPTTTDSKLEDPIED